MAGQWVRETREGEDGLERQGREKMGRADPEAVAGRAQTMPPTSLGLVLPQIHRFILQLPKGHRGPRYGCSKAPS